MKEKIKITTINIDCIEKPAQWDFKNKTVIIPISKNMEKHVKKALGKNKKVNWSLTVKSEKKKK